MERSGLYGLLASVYRAKPSAEILRRLGEPAMREGLAAAGVSTDIFTAPEPQLLKELAEEYTRLFVGPGKHLPPYQSVHLEGSGGDLWGADTSAVKRFIEQAGFDYAESFHGLPDHISVELDFLAQLTRLEAETWRNNDADRAYNCLKFQQEFMERHLGRWIPAFCTKVVERTEQALYREMAALTADFIAAERREIESRLQTTGAARFQ